MPSEYSPVGLVILVIGALCLYFLPALIATAREHHNAGAVFALNLLLGWTLLGWIGAIVWAFTRPGTASAPATAADDLTRRPCPWCAERILCEAAVCRFCGREVIARSATVPR
jgi:hypothetical protein